MGEAQELSLTCRHPTRHCRIGPVSGAKSSHGYHRTAAMGSTFTWICILFLLLGTVAYADQDKDFEFEGENVIRESAKIVDGTFLDDEDYLHDEGSTPDDQGPGSGQGPSEMPTIYPTDPPTDDNPIFYRITINFTNIAYDESLGDRSSENFVTYADRYKRAIEGLFDDVPGQQTANILQFRPGTTDPDARPPSMLVTLDLGTLDYYHQFTIFNTLNAALSSGRIGSHYVSHHGFSMRQLSGRGPNCPKSIGRPATSLPRLGDTRANLMLNNRFICDGHLRSITYFRGDPEGVAYVGVWRQYGDLEFELRHKVKLPPAPVGLHTIDLQNPITVMRGDILGVHYPSSTNVGLVASSIKEDPIDETELFQTLCIDIRDEDMVVGKAMDFSEYDLDLLRKTYALSATLEYDLQPTTPEFTNIPTPSDRLTCAPNQFRCNDGSCIERYLECDSHFDCPDRSDEFHCSLCKEGEFPCGDGMCIDEEYRCNNQYDCADGSDERDCVSRCTTDQFECDDGTCLQEAQHCNNIPECSGGEDEFDCPTHPPSTQAPITTPSACEYYEFHCGAGECIDVRLRCNGRVECSNSADEEACDKHECLFYQFRCKNFRCIDDRRRCDSRDDCGDGSDERGCGACREGDEFECDDGTCVDIRSECNGHVDCNDGSDERDCPPPTCATTEYQCPSGRCIGKDRECDGYVDCEDGADEQGCTVSCTPEEFTCEDRSFCVDPARLCDGYQDCRDGSDERPSECAKPPCAEHEFTCKDGSCIEVRRSCDGYSDCADGSDEEGCGIEGCSPTEFTCADSSCIQVERKCDGRRDCQDGSDEHECGPTTCATNEFRCDSGSCIPSSMACDGTEHCVDGSDERDCPPVTTCLWWQFSCNNGRCIDLRRKCNGIDECGDRSDERGCDDEECSDTEFTCDDGECIDERRQCDGREDCGDASDENGCVRECDVDREFACASGEECVPISSRCDNQYDCRDLSDEADCPPPSCASGEHSCGDGRCLDSRRVCDDRADCTDGSDEANCPAPPDCRADQFECNNEECIDLVLRCDRQYDCLDGSDEFNCVSTCSPLEFRCDSGECITSALRCNREYNCRDGSDEFQCVGPRCSENEFTCTNGECIDMSMRCNREYNCRDGSDETDCDCRSDQYKCRDGTCVDGSARCNGRVDCRDSSDEEGCRPVDVELDVSPEALRIREGMAATFICRVRGGGNVYWTKDTQPLPSKATDANGRLHVPDAQVSDSGRYKCVVVGSDDNFAYATLTVEYVIGPIHTPAPPVGDCDSDQMECNNRQCIARDYSCDGDFDCSDRSDELNCLPLAGCEPNEFQCSSGKCVQKIWLCDGDDDCGDNSDEQNCPTAPPNSRCRADEFLCSSVEQCIPASFQCDGEPDCQDRSDESGCVGPTVIRPPPAERYAAQGETVVIECIARGTPTPLIVWRLNWGHIGDPPRVSYESADGRGVLTIRQVRKEDEGAYTCEALNSKGSVFAQPDTILVVSPPVGICTPPFFNSEAARVDECLQCFCFDLTDHCVSSSMFISSIMVGNVLPLVTRDTRTPIVSDVVEFSPMERQFMIRDYDRRVTGEQYYWSLPEIFLGNKITSYGGSLAYSIMYEAEFTPEFIPGPDVIMQGNGVNLYHSQFTEPFSGREQQVDVSLMESAWSLDEYGRQRVSRGDFILALENLDYILVKSNFDNRQRQIRISGIEMTTTANFDQRRGPAILVEECSCPTGYSGTSCESCTSGYYRVESGSYLGRCLPCDCHGHSNDCDPQTGRCLSCQHHTTGSACDRCEDGYYGDALRGTPSDCQRCPCPLTSQGNNFATTCYLETNGQVICEGCRAEYTGSQCERCAPGYEGDPRIPGDYCKPSGHRCDPKGSISTTPDPSTGYCSCKRYATGPSCNQCSQNSFYLAEDYPTGCIPCFCMGVTSSCSSTTYNRAQVSLGFSRDAQGVELTNPAQTESHTEGLFVSRGDRMLTFNNFRALPQQDAYYWSLPRKFLADKVTSYGGNLRYTINHVDGPFPSHLNPSNYPDVQIRGNDIVLEYTHSQSPAFATGPFSFQVPLYEQYWRQTDNNEATREQMLMVLANLDYILVKATYTSSTQESSIRDISLDIAEDRSTGLGRASEVEQCQCPVGYRGLSCEDCDHGYTRTQVGGLYLGNCERCDCYGHSNECDTTTGSCRACQHNTEGRRCERCSPGYYGDPTRGTPQDCQPCPCPLIHAPNQFSPVCELDRADGRVTCTDCPPGHTGRSCESCLPGYEGNPLVLGDYCKSGGRMCDCDPRGTIANTQCNPQSKECQCKAYTSGRDCDTCQAGYFFLEEANPQGCMQCYCSGIASQCSSSRYYRDQIRPVLDASAHNFMLTSRRLSEQITDGFRVDANANKITFTRFEDVQNERQSLFFSLPPRFKGNQVASYGGTLKFTLELVAAVDAGQTIRDVDLELISNGNRLYHIFRQPPTPYELNQYSILLRESSFRKLDGTEPSRETFLSILGNLDAILIRATHHEIMSSASLRDLTMDTAVPQNTGQEQASIVEQCSCPAGYTGLSCQECASGYFRIPDPTNPMGRCGMCDCNGHSQTCDESGSCVSCQHNTEGDRCQRCMAGFYGDASVGTPNDCRACPCPLTLSANQFSPTCYLDRDGSATCDACPPEYTGRNCDRCAPQYIGDPREPGSSCIPDTGTDVPQVEVSPKTIAEAVNANVTFTCRVRGRGPFNVEWTREDGRPLSPRAVVGRDNSLSFRLAQNTDAGSYMCTAYSTFGRNQDDGKLVIVGERSIRVVVREPRVQNVQEGATVRFVCEGHSKYTYTLAWTRETGLLPYFAEDDGHGLLVIRNVRAEDAGIYECIGSNAYDIATDTAQLIVSVGQEAPNAVITPRVVYVNIGDLIQLSCTATGRPRPEIVWSRQGVPMHTFVDVRDGVLRIPAAREEDGGEYTCTATNDLGTSQIRVMVHIQGAPQEFEVFISKPEVRVYPGADTEMDCAARGAVVVETIEWTREGQQLPPGSRQQNGILVIPNCQLNYEGRYVCTITLATGAQNRGYSNLIVENRPPENERPTATMETDRITITQGTTGTLRCHVTGNPTPTIAWSKVRAELGPNHQVQGNMLRILEATPEDRGLYVCRAENSAGSAQASAIIEVERREMPRVEIYPDTTTSIAVGGSALFQCRVLAGIPSPEVIWQRGNNEQFTSNTDVLDAGVLRFNQVTGDEQGPYVCTATNAAGTITATASLKIQGLPRVVVTPAGPLNVRSRQRVSFECVAEGDPPATVYWQAPSGHRVQPADALAQPGNSAYFSISAVSLDDAGTYVCLARNEVGQSQATIQIVVEDHTSGGGGGREYLSVTVIPSQVNMAVGGTAQFACQAIGNPRPQVSWRREGGSMPTNYDSTDGILQIYNVRSEDAGRYICLARSAAGQEEITAQLNVQVPPEVSTSPSQLTVRTGEMLRLRCSANTGTQPITIEWAKIGGALSFAARVHNGVLEIQPVTAADAGRYKCVAINDYGRSEAYVDVTLHVAPSATVSPTTLRRNAGATVEFQCESGGSVHSRIRWVKQGGDLPDQHQMLAGTLVLYNVQPEDSGIYVCVVSNDAGDYRAFAELTVLGGHGGNVVERVQTVAEGSRVEINCAVAAADFNPAARPVIRWDRVGMLMPADVQILNDVLVIARIQADDAGTYRCTATNTAGQAIAQVVIRVEAPPKISLSRQVRTASLGSRVTLTCDVTGGSPPPTIQWRKMDGDLPSNHVSQDGSLTIQHLRQADLGEYICMASNRFGSVEGHILLDTGELVPFFDQNPVSYVSYPTINDAYLEFDIEMSFKPQATEGLLLYNGVMDGSNGDFVSFGIKDKRAELRFNVGAGPAIIVSEPLSLDEWHTVNIHRDKTEGTLVVNGHKFQGESPGDFRGLDLAEDLYVGGLPDFRSIASSAGFNQGFVGCVSRVVINGEPLDLGASAHDMSGVRDCPVCHINPCDNRGRCKAAQTEMGYSCECPSGFSGKDCELIGERCFQGACGDGGRCYDLPDNLGYKCACPVGKTGDRCQSGVEITEPSFSFDSYIAYPTMRDALLELQIYMMVKPESLADSILLYNAQGMEGMADYVALLLRNGFVEFHFNLGSGPAVIRSNERLVAGEWATILAGRDHRDGSLSVNNEQTIKGQSPVEGFVEGDTVGLNLDTNLFLGGVERAVRLPHDLGVDTGFHGCISQLVLKGTAIDLINDAIDSNNVRNCGVESPCAKHPCEHNGVCIELSTSDYRCNCPPNFTGYNCEQEMNVCVTNNPCGMRGQCVVNFGRPDCHCFLGFTGPYCQQQIDIYDNIQLDGTGYAELSEELLPHHSAQMLEVIEMTVSTRESEAILFWQGQNATESLRGNDYLAVLIQNGRVVFSYELGSGPANITSRQRVDDGYPHIIILQRTGNMGSVQVDSGHPMQGNSEGILSMLNTSGNIFIGGLPNMSLMTNDRFHWRLNGCIRDVYINGQGPIDFGSYPIGGINVLPCDTL